MTVPWKIGPTFLNEIKAAGVDTQGWGWRHVEGTFWFDDPCPQATRDGVAAVYAVHDPAKQTDPPTPYPPGSPPIPGARLERAVRWKIDKRTVLERLDQAHRFEAFQYALDASTALTQALWQASQSIWNDDPLAVGLIQKAGADPALILAYEETP